MSLDTRRLCNDPIPSVHTPPLPVATLGWSKVSMYYQPSGKPRDPLAQQRSTANLTRGTYNGYMSPATKRKFRAHASTWIRSIMLYRSRVKRKWDPGRAYPTMITLTLPVEQTHTDREIYRACLMPWLQMMRRDHGVEHYVWRAEAQENGNLHYHVIVDKYIPKRVITASWNQCIDVLDYRRRYWEESGSLTPPSTEVHAVRDRIKDRTTGEWRNVDPVNYLIEYLMEVPTEDPNDTSDPATTGKPKRMIGTYRSKDGSIRTYTTRAITGRVWGMSDKVREVSDPKCDVSLPMLQALEAAKDAGRVKRVDLERATVYFGKVASVLGQRDPGLWKLIEGYYLHVFGWLYPGQLPDHYKAANPPMDPRGLWIDPVNYAYHYPPTYSERQDAYNEQHQTSEDLQVTPIPGGLYLRAKPELAWKSARIARKMQRLQITNLHQRWHVRDSSSPYS